MNDIGTIMIRLVVGLLAQLATDDRRRGAFVMIAVFGAMGAIAASWFGQFIGWYRPGQTAGFIGAVVGAIIVVAVRHALARFA